MHKASTLRLIAAAAGSVLAASAFAGYTNPGVSFTALNSQGSGSVNITLGQGTPLPGGGWQWVLFGPPIPIQNGGGTNLGFINQGTVTLNDSGALVGLSFAVTAGAVNTQFIIDSSVVSFSPFAAQGRASAGLTVTDNNGNGGTVTGNRPGGAVYTAQYNGAVPGGTTFADLIPGPLVEPFAFGSESTNQSFPAAPGVFAAIPGTVSDISARWDFTVTAGDQASGTSVWVVTPAPGGLALIGLGAIALAGRRR